MAIASITTAMTLRQWFLSTSRNGVACDFSAAHQSQELRRVLDTQAEQQADAVSGNANKKGMRHPQTAIWSTPHDGSGDADHGRNQRNP